MGISDRVTRCPDCDEDLIECPHCGTRLHPDEVDYDDEFGLANCSICEEVL